MKTYKGLLDKLPDNGIFVFGSNTQGRHGKGAALWAKENAGAIYGRSTGLQNDSYAICTKDISIKPHKSMNVEYIIDQIRTMYKFARISLPNYDFYIAYQGTGTNLNGYTPEQMATMFASAGKIPNNIVFEEKFAEMVLTISYTCM